MDKQLVGQVAAEIRDYRPPEPIKEKVLSIKTKELLGKNLRKHRHGNKKR